MRRLFVKEYLVDKNATQAAIRAGYSPHSARSFGSQLLTFRDVAEAVERGLARQARRTEISAERVLRELALVAFSDIGDVVRVDGDGKVFVNDLESMEPEARRSIAEITQTTTERIEPGKDGEPARVIEKIRLGVKQHSKVAALKMLADHLGLSAPVKQEIAVEVTTAKQSLESKLDALRGRLGPGTDESG